jgi:hypothetical protein
MGDADSGLAPGEAAAEDAEAAEDERRADELARQVRVVVQRHKVQLMRCYERAAKAGSLAQPLAGRVDIQFVITPEGTANGARPVENTTGSDTLARCLATLIESWRFPASGDRDIELVWPFLFKAPS